MFPSAGGRGGGMMMTSKKGPASAAASTTMPLNDALNLLIQGYIKGKNSEMPLRVDLEVKVSHKQPF
jgi:hypothetical protein